MARKVRDHYAPKRCVSAFVHYQNAMRESIRLRFPGIGVSDFAKLTSDFYEKLSSQDKAVWEACAIADKKRFDHEMRNYQPPPGYDANGNATMEVAGDKRRRLQDTSTSPQYQYQQPFLSASESGELMATMNSDGAASVFVTPASAVLPIVQKVDFNGSDKGTYNEAQQTAWALEQIRSDLGFEQALRLFPADQSVRQTSRGNLSRFPKGYGQATQPFDPESVTRKRGRPKRKKDRNAPKRCRTAFVLFASDERPKILSEFPGISFVEMGNILGKRWKACTPEDKADWEKKAAEDKTRYFQQMDVYKAKLNASDQTRENFTMLYEWGSEDTFNVASPSPISAYNMELLHFPPLPYTEIDSQLLESNRPTSSNSDTGSIYCQSLQMYESYFSV
jgi:hypothetical protein